MKSLLDAEDRREIVRRLMLIHSDRPPKWGKMTPRQVFAHMAAAIRMATGELNIPPMSLPSRFWPIRQVVLVWIRFLPFPHGAPTSPSLLSDNPPPLEQSRREIMDLLDHFAASTVERRDHPAFGPLSRRTWGILTYRHLDHHLRQLSA